MKTIQEEWEKYRRMVEVGTLSPSDESRLRKAFVAGQLAMFANMIAINTLSNSDVEALLSKSLADVERECSQYQRAHHYRN